MKALKTLIICLIASFSVFSQENEINLAVQATYGFYIDKIGNGASFHTSKIDAGVDFQRKSNDFHLYLSLGYNKNHAYKGFFLGGSFETHFLNNKKRIRPYLGLSFSSEVATNYKRGFLKASSFHTRDDYKHELHHFYDDVAFYVNSSGFYLSTPLLSTLYVGGELLIIRSLRLNISLTYSVRVLRYQYLKWDDFEDYQEILIGKGYKPVRYNYIGAQIGLSYTFPIKKKEKE